MISLNTRVSWNTTFPVIALLLCKLTFVPCTYLDRLLLHKLKLILRRSTILAYTWYYIERSKLASENSGCITDNGYYADGGLVEIRPTYHVVAPRPLKL